MKKTLRHSDIKEMKRELYFKQEVQKIRMHTGEDEDLIDAPIFY